MSGIEVAGLVLGAIPLVVSGLEHYADGVRTVKMIFRPEANFMSLSRHMRVEDAVYREMIGRIILDCVDDQTYNNLMKDIDGKFWSDPNIAKELHAGLQQKLERSYSIFLETVVSMNTTLKKFKARLQLGPDGKGPFNDPKSLRNLYKGAQFAFRKSTYDELLESIRRDNSALDRLTQRSFALEPVRTRRDQMPDAERIRKQAMSVFSTLEQSLPGSCTASHRASLCLQGFALSRDKSRTADEMSFRLILHHESMSTVQVASSWTDKETELRAWARLPPSEPIQVPTSPPHGGTRPRPSLRFSEPAMQTATQVKPQNSDDSAQSIQNLCASFEIVQSSHCGGCIGYLEDVTTKDRIGIYHPKEPLFGATAFTTTSLADLLGRELNGLSSRRIALMAAKSVLQLYETPWLPRRLDRHDIMIFKKDGLLLADYPFVSAAMGGAPGNLAADVAESRVIRNATVFALGVLLIELCLGKTIDDPTLVPDPRSSGSKKPPLDFMTAVNHLDRVYGTNGLRYGDAVRRCIYCEFDQRATTLGDAQFRKAVYAGVVVPLEEDIQYFSGGS
ncbi:hypothetical protein LTR97_002874 [Elasticomyces elasticus]|uniref:DUF7580 domain-containing protein n=1 Tax=Elasticomyces elasticus TaxID=574655 RepID=A0AAN7VU70_9PEZI|nr:hypothetical protein LTR97_002874 [Elasticomyces elasticus]